MTKERGNQEPGPELAKNHNLIERIRKDGYYAVLFSKTDFMDAVVWAANLVYDFKDFVRNRKDRIVIDIEDMPFRKDDVVNAHFLMIVYYKNKENHVMVEEIKQGLFAAAKFQKLPPEDREIMRKWDDYMFLVRKKQDSGDLSGSDASSLKGTEIKYERYSGIVQREINKYQEDLAKL